ncbi:MAG: bifunctional ornithine acetyltransferase/N-acetylglutamate synthase [Gammaproteobacteria bacterium RIFCSPLOWO2_02_FULL_52_10]|jgi:glutamate N-acetyltransferase/amino-acid N-acetyltransferase|nr:MAG: bifunctional ornithine acetyltransferase/N-acetylglutamate synthase [Gammaproteobacteria bacterium RIFCSPLOWO2_02_FULL_52_10]
MAVGLIFPDNILPVRGLKLSAGTAGIYQKLRLDTVLLSLDPAASCAAVFTRNAFCAAPVQVAKLHMGKGPPRYCIINAGNANAGTGARGYRDAMHVCETIAELTGSDAAGVLPFSTGVIGEFLPVEKICNILPQLISGLDGNNWIDCATAIMTTDTIPKAVSRSIEIEGDKITITGIAKGSGMIRPDMATMLAFLATDAAVTQPVLEKILHAAVAKSFNRICVDGDTSSNDACVLIATGAGNMKPLSNIDDKDTVKLQNAIADVCVHLAQAIVRDGEGATKFVTIRVLEGATTKECLDVAYSIATSPLVKTALFASDPNWGRILAAAGRSGLRDFDISRVRMDINDVCIVENGMRSELYTENRGRAELEKREILVQVYLGRGNMEEILWTCDLSFDYVRINAEYRT